MVRQLKDRNCQLLLQTVFAQLTAEGVHTPQWAAHFPQKLPLCMGDLDPTPLSIPNGISIGSAVFAQLTAESPHTLQWAAPFPIKLSLPMGGSGPPYNAWFLRPTQVHNPNDISISSVFLQGSRSWQTNWPTDRPTDRPCYSVCNYRPHLHNYVALRCDLKLFICVCISLCTIIVHNTAQNSSDNFPTYPQDNQMLSSKGEAKCYMHIGIKLGTKLLFTKRRRKSVWTHLILRHISKRNFPDKTRPRSIGTPSYASYKTYHCICYVPLEDDRRNILTTAQHAGSPI